MDKLLFAYRILFQLSSRCFASYSFANVDLSLTTVNMACVGGEPEGVGKVGTVYMSYVMGEGNRDLALERDECNQHVEGCL